MFAPLIPMDLFKKWSRFRNFHDVVGGGGLSLVLLKFLGINLVVSLEKDISWA